MKKLLALAILILLAVAPAGAQTVREPDEPPKSQADCIAQWRAADANGDGQLDRDEINAARRVIPPAIMANPTIDQQDFISACTTAVESDRN